MRSYRPSRRTAAILTACLLTLGAAAVAGPATATPGGSGSGSSGIPVAGSGLLGENVENCTAELQPVPVGGDLSQAPEPVVECFDSTEAAAAHILDELGIEPAPRAGAWLAAQAATPSAVDTLATTKAQIALVYKGRDYTGDRLTLWGQGSVGCTTGLMYGFPDTGKWGYSNNIRSVRPFFGCKINLYDGREYTKNDLLLARAYPGLSVFDKITQSIVMRP